MKLARLIKMLAPAATLMVVAPSLHAADADPTVAKSLKKLKLNYELDADNDYKMVMNLGEPEGRTQLVFVGSAVHSYGSLSIREVFSPAFRVPAEGYPAEVAERLLRENNQTIIGDWKTSRAGDDYFAVFSAKVPANIKKDQLMEVISAVATTADTTEKALTNGADEF